MYLPLIISSEKLMSHRTEPHMLPYWISAYSSISETCPCSICLLRCSPLSLLDLCDSGYFSGHRSSSLWTQCSVFLPSLSSPWAFLIVMSGSSHALKELRDGESLPLGTICVQEPACSSWEGLSPQRDETHNCSTSGSLKPKLDLAKLLTTTTTKSQTVDMPRTA